MRPIPMTLGNMRENGVHSLAVTCGALGCHHQAVLDVSGFADDVAVPSFGPRMVWTVCGAIGAAARPNWSEHQPVCLVRSQFEMKKLVHCGLRGSMSAFGGKADMPFCAANVRI